MNGDVVADRMLDAVAVGDGEESILVIRQPKLVRSGEEHRSAVRCLDREPRLEEPRAVAVLLGLHLLVTQEQRHRPLGVDLPDDRLDLHGRHVRIGRAHREPPRRDVHHEVAATRHTLPHPPLAVGSLDPLVTSPSRRHAQPRATALDAEAQAERRREERLLRGLRLGVAVLRALVAARERLLDTHVRTVAAGSEQPEQVAVARLLPVREQLVLASGWAEEVALDHGDQLLTELRCGWRGED